MKTQESLYIKVLVWAYRKSVTGFTDNELEEEFLLKDGNGDAYKMYSKLFRDGNINSKPLIDEFYRQDGIHYYCLTEKGMDAAISYLGLEEARKSGEDAKKWALFSIWIAIIIGILQIIIEYNCY